MQFRNGTNFGLTASQIGTDMKVVINVCFGGFGLSEKAYEKLIEYGVPVRKYVEEVKDEKTGRYNSPPENEGEVIFDRSLSVPGKFDRWLGRYWETWIRSDNRSHPLVVRVVEELGDAASGAHAELKVVEIPDGVDYIVEEYDGNEHIAEAHRTWS